MDKRNIISYYDLSDKWQVEAVRNLDSEAENASYLEPLDNTNPTDHILWDLSEATYIDPNNNGGYNAGIPISNNSAMLLKTNEEFTEAEVKIV